MAEIGNNNLNDNYKSIEYFPIAKFKIFFNINYILVNGNKRGKKLGKRTYPSLAIRYDVN